MCADLGGEFGFFAHFHGVILLSSRGQSALLLSTERWLASWSAFMIERYRIVNGTEGVLCNGYS